MRAENILTVKIDPLKSNFFLDWVQDCQRLGYNPIFFIERITTKKDIDGIYKIEIVNCLGQLTNQLVQILEDTQTFKTLD